MNYAKRERDADAVIVAAEGRKGLELKRAGECANALGVRFKVAWQINYYKDHKRGAAARPRTTRRRAPAAAPPVANPPPPLFPEVDLYCYEELPLYFSNGSDSEWSDTDSESDDDTRTPPPSPAAPPPSPASPPSTEGHKRAQRWREEARFKNAY